MQKYLISPYPNILLVKIKMKKNVDISKCINYHYSFSIKLSNFSNCRRGSYYGPRHSQFKVELSNDVESKKFVGVII